EEECLIFNDRTPSRHAELILLERWARLAGRCEEGPRVELFVAEKLKECSMQVIGARPHNQADLCTRLEAVLCRIVARLHPKLLNRVNRGAKIRLIEKRIVDAQPVHCHFRIE